MFQQQQARALNAPGYTAATIAFVQNLSPNESYYLKPTDSIVELDLFSFDDDGPDIFFSTPVEDFPVQIRNINNTAGGGNWRLSSAVAGVLIEDPGAPGTFVTTVLMTDANSGGTWQYARAGNRWILLVAFPFPAAGGGGGGSLNYSHFYALMPGDNAATVAAGAAVEFPQDGASSGAAVRVDATRFRVPLAGVYSIDWQVSVAEAGQLMIRLNGVTLEPRTVAGRATGTSQISQHSILTLAADDVIEIINPPGNAAPLTITPTAGGTHAVSATLSIERVDVAGGGQGPAGPPFVQGAVSIMNVAPINAGGGPGSAANEVTHASAPFVTPASGKVYISANAQVDVTATNGTIFALWRDAGGVEVQIGPTTDGQGSANGTSDGALSWVDTTAPGSSHTYAIRVSNGNTNVIQLPNASAQVTLMGVT